MREGVVLSISGDDNYCRWCISDKISAVLHLLSSNLLHPYIASWVALTLSEMKLLNSSIGILEAGDQLLDHGPVVIPPPGSGKAYRIEFFLDW
jgi:hypothetical protein